MEEKRRLGTFLGVFTPTILTILGVIMYMRMGWVLGNMGLHNTLLIVILANSITLITTLSFSSVATNARVGTGGAYYIISRSLGLEIGTAIGIPLFLSQAFSITLYSYGLAESFRIIWDQIPIQEATFIIILIVAALSYKGAKTALKVQVPLMGLVVLSIIALTISSLTGKAHEMSSVSFGEITFWQAFAVFFPAVTGIMAGLGLSGDLKNPQRSIPLGATLATITGFAVYMAMPFVLSYGADHEALRNDSLIWTHIVPYGALFILPGLFGAIFSSAVGSMLSAPRTVQALSFDHIKSRRLLKLFEGEKSLRIGFAVTTLIALGAVMIGGLNLVATVVTMFFLTVYGTINIVAALETMSNEPYWRPKIRLPWVIYLLGGIACVFVMFLISPLASIIAIAIESALYAVLVRREQMERYGDVRRGVFEAIIKKALHKLADHPMSARNWRPHILVIINNVEESLDLIWFANWFSQASGIVTVCKLKIGDLLDRKIDLEKERQEMQKLIKNEGLALFSEVDVVPGFIDGLVTVSQANGMAGIQSNTVMIGWPKKPKDLADMLSAMKKLAVVNKSIILCRINPKRLFHKEGEKKTIHIWWGGLQRNGDLMILLAHLLVQNPEWRGSIIEIISIANNEDMKSFTENYLKNLIEQIRIRAESTVMVKPEGKGFIEIIHSYSKNADAVILGLNTPKDGDEESYAKKLKSICGDLQTVFFVKNSSVFVGELLEYQCPDSICEDEV